MQSLLDAIKDGRLVELPDNNKEKALQGLAHLLEAVPEMGGGLDLAEEVLKREKDANTGIGLGVACPHIRVSGNGDLLCAVGWSPAGIDYGSVDEKPVHLVFMYYIPDSAKNTYLKEISSVAIAIKHERGVDTIAHADDIASVRERLLDWVAAAIEAGIPEPKARMIRLEARQAVINADALSIAAQKQILSLLILIPEEGKRIVLCENHEIVSLLEQDATLDILLKQHAQFDRAGFRFVYRSTTLYDPSRPLYDYIAVKV